MARFRTSAVLPFLCFWGCASVNRQPRQPVSLTQGGLILSIKMEGYNFPYFLNHDADFASFAQIGPDGAPNMDRIRTSNFYRKPYIYLLNVPPGRYVPIAASYSFLGGRDTVIFDPETITDWTTEIKPGQIAFMGENSIYYEWMDGVELSTRCASHLRGFVPFIPKPVIFLESRLPTDDKSPAAQAQALRHAVRDLKKTLWLPAVETELEQTGNPPPPLWKDFFHRHKMKPLRTRAFSYFNILPGWRGPFRVPGGLEWREKHGRARIAISYVTPNSSGYESVSRYIEDMRSAGAAGDDHLVSQIRFSTWTAYSAIYNSYDYPAANLVGSKVKTYRTRTILVPNGNRYYLIHYRSLEKYFKSYEGIFDRFIWHVVLTPPKPKTPPGS
ncbi:MAG: hypothetical protein ACYCPQ_03580 [Elusimicrobiota bacterium]